MSRKDKCSDKPLNIGGEVGHAPTQAQRKMLEEMPEMPGLPGVLPPIPDRALTRNTLRAIVGVNAIIVETLEPMAVFVVVREVLSDDVMERLEYLRPVGVKLEVVTGDDLEQLILDARRASYQRGLADGLADRWWRKAWAWLTSWRSA